MSNPVRDFWKEQYHTNREEAAEIRFDIQEKRQDVIDSFIDENQLWGDLSFVAAGDFADVHFETIALNIANAAMELCFKIAKAWK